MRHRLVLFAAVVIVCVCAECLALEVIVDNSDPGCTALGAWSTSTSGCYGPDKFTHGPGAGSDTVTWTASLPAGWYVVYFRMNSNTGYTTEAQYTVTHRDGVENLTVSQRKGSAGWYVLGGAYYFDGTASVVLSDSFDAATGSLVIADAIRFWSVFSFVQMSDSHFGYSLGNTCGTQVGNELKSLGQVSMAGYGFRAPPPSFAIHCGDLTEYGQEYWNTAMNAFSGVPFPIYHVLGNHDSTQNSLREKLRSLHGGPFYTMDFDDRGSRYHFVMLDSTVIQSPRASFTREELDFLASDLAGQDPGTRTFLVLHHPINGASDPKPYDSYRLLETIRPYNVPVIFYGHGHSFNQSTFDGVRIVQGGSTYNNSTGIGSYSLVAVTHGRMHVAKKVCGEPTAATGILNMLLPSAPAYPIITVDSPSSDSVETSPDVAVSTSIDPAAGAVTAVEYELDGDGIWRSLSGAEPGPFTGTLNLAGEVHGRHWIRVRYTMVSGGPYYKTVSFWAWDDYPKARWMVDLGATSQCTPAVSEGRVFVGANGGAFRCLNAVTGSELWSVAMPSDIVSASAVSGNRVVLGCGDGKVYCLSTGDGSTLWSAPCSGPVYSPPAIDGSAVYVGSNGTGASKSARLYSLDLVTGAENWSYAADNAIESKPCFTEDTVFFGAWDSYFYAIHKSTGTLRWRYQRNTSRYYSPADSWPVASSTSGQVYVADRQYYLSAINIASGTADWTRTGISSQALTPDGGALFLRVSSGNLERTSFSNATVWTTPCSLDSAPVSPACASTRVAAVDQDGLVNVLDAASGETEYSFQAAHGYQLHPVALDVDGTVYVSTYDGFLISVANGPYQSQVTEFYLY